MSLKPAYRYSACLKRVIDGDTFVLTVDLGFSIHVDMTLRLLSSQGAIDCPEMRTKEGREVKAFVDEWFAYKNDSVTIETTKPDGAKDKYGRYLAMVYAGEKNLGDRLLELGLATRKDW